MGEQQRRRGKSTRWGRSVWARPEVIGFARNTLWGHLRWEYREILHHTLLQNWQNEHHDALRYEYRCVPIIHKVLCRFTCAKEWYLRSSQIINSIKKLRREKDNSDMPETTVEIIFAVVNMKYSLLSIYIWKTTAFSAQFCKIQQQFTQLLEATKS